MKRIMTIAALLAATMSITATAGAKPPPPPPPADAYVDGAGVCALAVPCYTTIQAGVNNAPDDGVVYVFPGVYHEHVSLGHPVTLRGADKNKVTIDGDGSGPVVELVTNGAAMSQLSVTNAGGDNGVQFTTASANQLSKLRVSGAGRGMFFQLGSSGNTVTDTEVSGTTLYGIDLGDTSSPGNQFLRMKIHDNAGRGFNGYWGSDETLLSDSDVSHNGGTGVQIGFSLAWTVQKTHIHHNGGAGIVTDTVWSGDVANNHIDHNAESGMDLGGYGSTVTTSGNHIDHNGWDGITLRMTSFNVVQNNVIDGNAEYALRIMAALYLNWGNTITGNRLVGPNGSLGDAFDDRYVGANDWSGNFYGLNKPYVAPYTIPGAAGAVDATPLMK